MKRIILTGFMGTGKSSVGRLLAEKLNYAFVDTDTVIEEKQGLSIPQIFSQYGEAYFRQVEKNILKQVCKRKSIVISTGGGVPLAQENRRTMQQEDSVVVCLRASIVTIMDRIKDRGNRPLLKQDAAKMQALLDKRTPFYNEADFIIDTDKYSPMQLVDEITTFMRRYKN